MISMDQIQGLLFSGGQVVGDDGKKIGAMGEVFLDAQSGQPAWVTVKTGLFGNGESFVPLVGGSVHGDEVRVPYGKDQVKHAPRIESEGGHLSPAEERDLYRHYGLLHDDDDADTGTHEADGHDVAGRSPVADHVNTGPGAPPAALATSAGVRAGAETGARTGAQADVRDDRGGPVDDVRTDQGGPVDDGSMVRSEEQLRVVGTERVPTERVRMRRYTVTENKTITVPVSREEFRLEYEPEAPGATGEVVELADDPSAGRVPGGHQVAPSATEPVADGGTRVVHDAGTGQSPA